MSADPESPRLSVIGGVVYPRKRIPLSKGGFSWPFARLALYEDRVELRPRGIFARVGTVVVIPYALLSYIEVSSPPVIGLLGGTVFFRSTTGDFDRVSFSAWRPAFRKVVDELVAMGVKIGRA